MILENTPPTNRLCIVGITLILWKCERKLYENMNLMEMWIVS